MPDTDSLPPCLPLQGLRNKPKKTGHVKPDLIDVDLVRGEKKVCVRANFLSIKIIRLDSRQAGSLLKLKTIRYTQSS